MVLSQNYIVKMAIFVQKYHHQKELSYGDFKDIFGNGMASGQRWQYGKPLILTLVFIRIALLYCTYSAPTHPPEFRIEALEVNDAGVVLTGHSSSML